MRERGGLCPSPPSRKPPYMSSRALVFVGIGPDHTSDNFNVLPISRYEKWCCPIISGALAFVGTGLNEKSDNFKVPFCSCYVKGRCSIICGALVFVGIVGPPLVFVGTCFYQQRHSFETSTEGCRTQGRPCMSCILDIGISWLVQALLKKLVIIFLTCHHDALILLPLTLLKLQDHKVCHLKHRLSA